MSDIFIKVQVAGLFVWNRLKEGWADESGGIGENTVTRALFIALAIAVVAIIAAIVIKEANGIGNLITGAGGGGATTVTTAGTGGVVPGG